MTRDDGQAMLDAGAQLLQIYTGFVYAGPTWFGAEPARPGSRAAVLRRSERHAFVCERRRSRRVPSAIRSERSEQLNARGSSRAWEGSV